MNSFTLLFTFAISVSLSSAFWSGDKKEPEDCLVSLWGEWSKCENKSTHAEQTRTRTKTHVEKNGGTCNYKLTDSKCCAFDCQYTMSKWSSCCNADLQNRSVTVTVPAQCGGQCPVQKVETRKCGDGEFEGCCAADCKMSDWSSWSECDAECDASGFKSRTRSVVEAAKCGGKVCGHLTEKTQCQGVRCECKFESWMKQDTCAGDSCQSPSINIPSCGQNFQLKSRTAEIVLNSTSIKNCCQINFFADAEQQTYVMMHSPALDTMLCPQNNMTLHQQSALSSSWQQRVSSCYSNLNQLNMIVGGPFSLLFSTERLQWSSTQKIIINTVKM